LDYQLGPVELNDVREAHLAIVILADDPSTGLAVIEEVHKNAPATQVLAVAANDRHETIVGALRAGADEFLPLPLDPNALMKVCIKVSALRRAAKPNGGSQHAQVWVAYGAKGGVGVTTLVANLGIALQAAGRRTVLLDLDLHSGDLALFLNLNPGYTLRDIATTKRLDTVYLQGTMIRHRSGLELIAAPVPLPGEAPLALTSEQTLAILKLLDTTHQVALVDTTSVPLDATRAALTNADRIFLVTELTLPALRATMRALAWLREEGVELESTVEIVVNKHANRSWEVAPAEAAKTLGLPIRTLLPRDDAQAEEHIRATLERVLQADSPELSGLERERLIEEVGYEVFGLGPLDSFLKDADVSDILVNGPDAVYIEKQGRLALTDVKFRDEAHLMQVIDRIVSAVGRRVDRESPMVDARLPDGSRVNAIVAPLAVRGPCLSIRRFGREPYRIDNLLAFGALTPEMVRYLAAVIQGRLNVI